jgi:hypothetical protein
LDLGAGPAARTRRGRAWPIHRRYEIRLPNIHYQHV